MNVAVLSHQCLYKESLVNLSSNVSSVSSFWEKNHIEG